jgi:hypothetical protein
MNDDRLTVREILLSITGAAIGLLAVSSGYSFYKHDYQAGLFCIAVALILGFVFFRKRKTALVICSSSCILALVTLGLPFHPSLGGFLLLIGSAATAYLTVYWNYKRYPYLSYKHVHAFFDGEAAMAAENARIEAEARELVKKRPYGPWLFR